METGGLRAFGILTFSMRPFIARAARYFEFAALGTFWRTEFLAGVTTFMTMAYIIFVNPSILHDAGMPIAGVTAATCLAAAVGIWASKDWLAKVVS